MICDPHQSIYELRGGVTEQLFAFGRSFAAPNQLSMTGNFRSSSHICKAIVALRAPSERNQVDQALGDDRAERTPIHVVAYSGTSVPKTVGAKFRELTAMLGLDPAHCPILAATRLTGARALGQPAESGVPLEHNAFWQLRYQRARRRASPPILGPQALRSYPPRCDSVVWVGHSSF